MTSFFSHGFADRFGVTQQLRPHLLDIALGVRQIIGKIDFFRLGDAHLHDGQLRPILVDLDARLHLHEIVAIDVARDHLKLIPHARFDGAAAVAQLHAQIRAPLARVAHFFFVNEEEAGDGLFGKQVGDVRRLHAVNSYAQAPPDAVPGALAEEQKLLAALLDLGDFGRGIDFLNFGVAAAGDVLIAGLDHHVALLAQRLQILAQLRLHALFVQVLR